MNRWSLFWLYLVTFWWPLLAPCLRVFPLPMLALVERDAVLFRAVGALIVCGRSGSGISGSDDVTESE